jgi:anti-sigma-K factor RskA
MNATCDDRDHILKDGTPTEWTALEAHAATCSSCAEELRAWKSLSMAAEELRDYTDSPSLWPRIQRSLAEESARTKLSKTPWSREIFWQSVSFSRQAIAASAVVLVLTFSAGWFYLHRAVPAQSADFLKTKALAEVERTESAYMQAIDKLAADAKPQLENPETPLLANYREKLLVLDSAIDDLRAQTGQNPCNAHLRYQLLAMYQEKQRTLQEILEEKR